MSPLDARVGEVLNKLTRDSMKDFYRTPDKAEVVKCHNCRRDIYEFETIKVSAWRDRGFQTRNYCKECNQRIWAKRNGIRSGVYSGM